MYTKREENSVKNEVEIMQKLFLSGSMAVKQYTRQRGVSLEGYKSALVSIVSPPNSYIEVLICTPFTWILIWR